MGKKKSFIDKKNATTFSLVFRHTEGDDRSQADTASQLGDAPGSAYGYGHGSYYGEQAAERSAPMSEARRREHLEYGFPDDGYDYMRHLRVLGHGRANLDGLEQQQPAQQAQQQAGASSSAAAEAAAAGIAELDVAAERQQAGLSTSSAGALAAPMQSVYIRAAKVYKPDTDVRLVDARRAAVGAAAAADILAPGGAPLPVEEEPCIQGRLATELAELMAEMDAAEVASMAGDTDDDAGSLDEFLAAAVAPRQGEQTEQEEEETEEGQEEGSDAAGAHELQEQGQQQQQQQQQQGRQGDATASGRAPGARDAEAAPNARAFAALNDQFEGLIGAYGDDQMGDLEDDSRAAGKGEIGHYGAAMAGFLQEEGRSERSFGDGGDSYYDGDEGDWTEDGEGEEGGQGGGGSRPTRGLRRPKVFKASAAKKVESLEQRDEEVLAATRARIVALEAAAEARAAAGGAAAGTRENEEQELMYVPVAHERWDCESVLSLRSNLSHHPARISEPGRGRRKQPFGDQSSAADGAGGLIKLSARTGLPAGYGSARQGLSMLQEQEQGRQGADAAAAGADSNGSDEPGTSSSGDERDEEGSGFRAPERRPGESAEERKARKAAVKEAQREARAAKKALKTLYKQEAGRQRKQGAAATKGSTFYIP